MTNNNSLSIVCIILLFISYTLPTSSQDERQQNNNLNLNHPNNNPNINKLIHSQQSQQNLANALNLQHTNQKIIENKINNQPIPRQSGPFKAQNINNKPQRTNIDKENDKKSKSMSPTELPLYKRQKLTLIGYASDDGPARHLKSFSKRYGLDLHLIGVGEPWGGFNDKINGFYNFIESIENTHNESIVLILDAYDTVPICDADDLLKKFNSFDADIVMSTGKDCWPDPNVGDFLYSRLSDKERETYKFFPWFLCPNS